MAFLRGCYWDQCHFTSLSVRWTVGLSPQQLCQQHQTVWYMVLTPQTAPCLVDAEVMAHSLLKILPPSSFVVTVFTEKVFYTCVLYMIGKVTDYSQEEGVTNNYQARQCSG